MGEVVEEAINDLPSKASTFELRTIYGVAEDRAFFIKVLVTSVFQKYPDLAVALKKCWGLRDDLRDCKEKIYFDVFQGILVSRGQTRDVEAARAILDGRLYNLIFGDENR